MHIRCISRCKVTRIKVVRRATIRMGKVIHVRGIKMHAVTQIKVAGKVNFGVNKVMHMRCIYFHKIGRKFLCVVDLTFNGRTAKAL